jgi:NADH-quinone oxidoreductase subunit N
MPSFSFQQLLAQTANDADTVTDIVTSADIQAILPALILFATGTVVLLLDCCTRTLSGTVKSSENASGSGVMLAIHFVGLLGTAIAGAFICASIQSPESDTFFSGAVRVDAFGSAISLVIVLGAFLSLLVAIDYLRRFDADHGEFHCLVLYAAGSMVLFAQSNNLIIAFLALETLSMAVYVLTAFLRDSRRSVEGGLKYFILGGFSTGFLLFGFALIYGATRQIELGPIAEAIGAGRADVPLLLAGLVLTLIGLGFKVGAFPFHSWLPDAYEGAPTVTTGFMAVTVKAAGFAVLLRFLVSIGGAGGLELDNGKSISEILTALLSMIAIATMIFGNFVAIVQQSVKRMLAYSAIGHTGYLMIGLVVALSGNSEGAAAAILFYLVPYTLMTLAAFALLGYLGTDKEGGDKEGSDAEDRERFEDYRGLSQKRPVVAFLLLVILLSFAGIPPTAGFWAKFKLFGVAIDGGHIALAIVGVLTSVVSIYFYLRLVVNFYMKPAEEDFSAIDTERRLATGLVIAAAAVAIVVLGLFPDFLFELSARSARALGR